jgi:filamentous hemagglutinin
MSLTTTGGINFTSAAVNAGSFAFNTGGDFLLNTAMNTPNQMGVMGGTYKTVKGRA